MVSNALLKRMPPAELQQLLSASELVTLVPRQVIHHYQLPMTHVYFVEHGLVSIAAKIGPEKFMEVWLVGAEGMVGAPLMLAQHAEPLYRRTVQVGGAAFRIAIDAFRPMLPHLPSLQRLLNAHLAAVLVQTSQAGACNAAHRLEQRLARWLLMARRGLERDDIPLTHGILAQLLCVRRASITDCLDHLERQAIVRTDRGLVVILDHRRLIDLCCNCFRIMDREYDRQLSWFPAHLSQGIMA
ncbi:Crp/Fnr family transcriptional regulator [Bradyrhizobium sp. CCBAU 53415]|uniref:Crp/Fnr family transcriptional regulator n=1 Tax=Bradyrhizobium sp. CCBAU 53415 TaxID=1325119 RepID=UPI002305B43D|nr:Crp/Fnr family transcriptional regulator [Bradyrhizobium sp. CCBAU 53415]